jgi:hypothetical protein
MYADRVTLTEARQLEQGDLVTGLIRPLLPTNKNILKLSRPPSFNNAQLAKAVDLAGDLAQLRGVNRIETVATALVVSNSCDNDGGDPIILAPVRPYEFADGMTSPAEQWRDISEAATGTASPKLFYLAGSAKFNISRSEAQIGDLFVLEQSFIDLCIQCGMARVCGLTPATVRHLQWHLATVFSRNPRDDGAWPSDDDKQLKLEWLEQELERGSNRYDLYRKERDELRAYFGVTAVSPTGTPLVDEDTVDAPSPVVEPTK